MKKIIIILICLGYKLSAHTLWIDDAFKVHQGHMHQESLQDSKHRMEEKELELFLCLKDASISKNDNSAIAKLGCSAVFITLKPTYYTKTPYGTNKTPKDRAEAPIESWLSVESVKRLYSDEKKIFNKGLELALRNNLSEIEIGDKARLTVYFNGKILEGAVVANGHKTIGISNIDGHINVKIREEGLQNIKASYSLKGDGVKCDKIIHTSTLNFKVKK